MIASEFSRLAELFSASIRFSEPDSVFWAGAVALFVLSVVLSVVVGAGLALRRRLVERRAPQPYRKGRR